MSQLERRGMDEFYKSRDMGDIDKVGYTKTIQSEQF